MQSASNPSPASQDPRVYLAAERTLLAWIRTGLALMGFGFVVARFGLFLRELAVERGQTSNPHAPGYSLWFGVALVAVGVLVNAFAAWDHRRIVRGLRAGDIEATKDSRMGVVLAILLAVIGGVMTLYLIVIR
jgi:putative membrane protein